VTGPSARHLQWTAQLSDARLFLRREQRLGPVNARVHQARVVEEVVGRIYVDEVALARRDRLPLHTQEVSDTGGCRAIPPPIPQRCGTRMVDTKSAVQSVSPKPGVAGSSPAAPVGVRSSRNPLG